MDEPLSILIIEDDNDTRENLCEILRMDGHRTFAAACYQDSREIARTNRIGLVITDRRLTEGMIEDFLEEVMSDSADAEVIVVTGFGDMRSTIAALRLGVADYVIKPVIPDDLRSIVNRVAEKQSLQAKLRHEEAFANEILKTTEAIILVLDLEGRVIRFNAYFEQLTQWTLADLVGKNWFENCIPKPDRERVHDVFIKTARDSRTRGIVNCVCGKDARCRRIRWSNTTLKDSHGNAEAILAAGVDISDLLDAQDRALHAERLAAIGQTMTALAHESRNALQRIKAASDMMDLEIQGNKDAQEELRSIRRATTDLELLHEEVRSFAAPIHVQPMAVGLPNVWRRAWEDLAHVRAENDAELVEDIAATNATIEVDSTRLVQVFRNLFENSIAACDGPARIEVKCKDTEDGIELQCCDNGSGMSEDQRKQVFDAFFTTKTKGTGLGMPISRRIIEAHGGTIDSVDCQSGAKFVIRLPRTQFS